MPNSVSSRRDESRLLLGVDSHVCREVELARERPVADAAHKRLLASVEAAVHSEVALLGETLPAHITLMGLLARVRPKGEREKNRWREMIRMERMVRMEKRNES